MVRAARPVACTLLGITDIRLLEEGVLVPGILGLPGDFGVPLECDSKSPCTPFGVDG